MNCLCGLYPRLLFLKTNKKEVQEVIFLIFNKNEKERRKKREKDISQRVNLKMTESLSRSWAPVCPDRSLDDCFSPGFVSPPTSWIQGGERGGGSLQARVLLTVTQRGLNRESPHVNPDPLRDWLTTRVQSETGTGKSHCSSLAEPMQGPAHRPHPDWSSAQSALL